MSNRRYDDNYNRPSSSFSSSLLEKICRSFDDEDDHNVISYRKSSKIMTKTNASCMETHNMYDFDRQNMLRYNTNNHNHKINNLRRNSILNFSSSSSSSSSASTSSSDSSIGIGGHLSTSESESSYMSSSNSRNLKLKPIRTSSYNTPETCRKIYSDESPGTKKTSHGESNNIQKRALKLYSELKKVKQPISPGGKLASFINSLFNSTASKKVKNSSPSMMTSSSRENFSTSLPSTASSYARSCLSKTPSTVRFDRRTVRFCPVNTVINDECNVVKKESIDDDDDELKVKIIEKHRRVEVAKELLKNYHHGRKYNQNEVVNMINKRINNSNDIIKIGRFENGYKDEYEDGDGDDNVSCCSSDLFELDNLVDIGVDRSYRQELPVYETTSVDANRAIANRFSL